MMFQKCLKLSQQSLAEASSGEIISIVNGELQVIEVGLLTLPYLFITPIIGTYTLILTSFYFKEGSLIGFVVFVVILVVQILIAIPVSRWKYSEGLLSDKRLKIITGAIHGIRTIK